MNREQNQVLTEQTEILLHQFAYGCYQNGLFEKAVRIFRVLTMFRSTDARYWYGLGSALMTLNRDSEAVHPFKIASVYAANDPRPRIYLAECLSRTDQKEEALKILSDTEPLLNKQENCSFQEQFQMIKERITKKETPLCQ